MNFTEEHTGVLEAHQHHWHTLRDAGYVANLDRPVFNALHQVHNEAIHPAHYTHWCSSCVAEMIRILYTAYETFLTTKSEENVPEAPTNKRRSRARTVLGAVQQGTEVIPPPEGEQGVLL